MEDSHLHEDSRKGIRVCKLYKNNISQDIVTADVSLQHSDRRA